MQKKTFDGSDKPFSLKDVSSLMGFSAVAQRNWMLFGGLELNYASVHIGI